MYGEDYFERGTQTGLSLYENYYWLPKLTFPMVESIIRHTQMPPKSSILDVGCAKGYIVRAFVELGYSAKGIDISKYAVEQADNTIADRISLVKRMALWPFKKNSFDWVITKDTLEHLDEEELIFVLSECRRVTPISFHVIPLGNGKKYFCKEYEKDVTHVLRQSMRWWLNKFRNNGFQVLKSSHRVKGIKDRWYTINPKGNGFFVIKRRE